MSNSMRKIAELQGLVTYHAANPCSRCGGTERYVSNGGCIGCNKRVYASRRTAARRSGAKSFKGSKRCKMCNSIMYDLETGKCSRCGGIPHLVGCVGYCGIYHDLVVAGREAPYKVPDVPDRPRSCGLCQRAVNRVRAYEKSPNKDPQLDAIYYRHVPRRQVGKLAGVDVYVFTWDRMVDPSAPSHRYYCAEHAMLHGPARFIGNTDPRVTGCIFCHHADLVSPFRAGQLKIYGEREE